MSESPAQHGRSLRKLVKRTDQGEFRLHSKRPSILRMINLSNFDRLPNLIPIRHARMGDSPFAFYRGTAGIMAEDLLLPSPYRYFRSGHRRLPPDEFWRICHTRT